MEKAQHEEVHKVLQRDPEFPFVKEFIDANFPNGGVWLIGSRVAMAVHHVLNPKRLDPPPALLYADWDIIVEQDPPEDLVLNPLFRTELNVHGCPRVLAQDSHWEFQIDLIPFSTIDGSLDWALRKPPLDVQALLFDMRRLEVQGEMGLSAIRRGEVAIQDYRGVLTRLHRWHARGFLVSVEGYVFGKAAKLGLSTCFPQGRLIEGPISPSPQK